MLDWWNVWIHYLVEETIIITMSIFFECNGDWIVIWVEVLCCFQRIKNLSRLNFKKQSIQSEKVISEQKGKGKSKYIKRKQWNYKWWIFATNVNFPPTTLCLLHFWTLLWIFLQYICLFNSWMISPSDIKMDFFFFFKGVVR